MQPFSFRSSNEIERDVKATNDDHKSRRITTNDGKGKIIHFQYISQLVFHTIHSF